MTATANLLGLLGLFIGASLLALVTTKSKISASTSRRLMIDPKSVEAKDPWKQGLLHRLDRIRHVCGDLCSITDEASFALKVIEVPGGDFNRIEANVDCDAIIGDENIDAADPTVPYPPPEELMPFYTLNGMIHYKPFNRLVNVYLDGNALENVWTLDAVEAQMKAAADGTLPGTYGAHATTAFRDELARSDLTGKSVMVIGSEKPWVEVICLYLGASKVTTLEYGAIKSEHPQLKTLTPTEFRRAYQDGSLGQFDMIVSYSSLEHSGLGRYGDALNPWGDILGVARAWCVTKSGGQMFLGLPMLGEDSIEFNAHRSYGKIRWPIVATNWKQADIGKTRFGSYGGTTFLFDKVNEDGDVGKTKQEAA